MKTMIKRAAGAILIGLLPVGVLSAAQVNVTTPAGPAGGVNVQAGPAGTNVVVPPGTGAAVRENAAVRQENRVDRRADRQVTRDDWRMVNHQNRWWYYHPNNTWSYYGTNRWTPWRAPANSQYTATQSMPAQPRRFSSGYRGPLINNNNPPVTGATIPDNGPVPNGQVTPSIPPADIR
jgi:hypothetical protein